MATLAAVFTPDTSISVGASLLGPSGVSSVIVLGKRRLFRVWTDNPSGLSISFGLTTGVPCATPTAANYSIGPIPQDFDLGDALDSFQLGNNSSISSAHYFVQVLSKLG